MGSKPSIEPNGIDLTRAAAIFRALGLPHGLAVYLRLAAHAEGLPPGGLGKVLDLPAPRISEALQALEDAGLVRREGEGEDVWYGVNPGWLEAALAYATCFEVDPVEPSVDRRGALC